MRKIIVRGRKEDLEKLRIALKGSNVNAFFYEDKVEIYIPDADTEEFIEKVKSLLDMRYRDTIIEVYKPEIVLSTLSRREEAEKRTPLEIIIDSTKPYTSIDLGKVALTSIAGIIAFSGLMMNNAVIIIGAMLLAPLLGPIHSFAINLAIGKIRFALGSISNLLANLLFVIVFSTLTSLVLIYLSKVNLTEEILIRTQPNPIYVIIAIALGFAAVLSLSKGIQESVAGVAIAASILPPAVTTGILLVLNLALSLKALILTMENVAGLLMGSVIAIYALGIRPEKYYSRRIANVYLARTVVFLGIVVTLLIFLTE